MRHTHDGTRLLVVCDVALGKCHDVRKRDLTLTRAPDGYHSVHGVRSAPSAESDFEVSGREEGLPLKKDAFHNREKHPPAFHLWVFFFSRFRTMSTWCTVPTR